MKALNEEIHTAEQDLSRSKDKLKKLKKEFEN